MISAQASVPVIGVDGPPLRICAGPKLTKLQDSTEAAGPGVITALPAACGRSGPERAFGFTAGSPPQPPAVTAPRGASERTFA